MKTLLKGLFLSTALLSSSAFAGAWSADYAQGNSEFIVHTDAAKSGISTVNFSCPDGTIGLDVDPDIFLTVSNGAVYSVNHNGLHLVAKVDGENIQLSDLTSRAGLGNWKYFWGKVSKTKSTAFTLVVGEGKDAFSINVPTTGVKAAYQSVYAENCLRF